VARENLSRQRVRVSQPTPIRISRRTRTALIVLGIIALGVLMWAAPTVPVVLLGGFALALVLSFPVRWLSHLMPRWLAMLITFVLLAGIISLAFLVLVPILIVQLVSFVKAVPHIATVARDTMRSLLQPLTDSGILKETPDEFMVRLGRDLLDLAQSVGKQVLGRLVGFLSGTISVILTLFGVLFVSVYLLANVRKIKATFLMGGAEALQARRRRTVGKRRSLSVALFERTGA